MYALYVCLIYLPYMIALCISYMYALYAGNGQMPYMYALYVCLICMPYTQAMDKEEAMSAAAAARKPDR